MNGIALEISSTMINYQTILNQPTTMGIVTQFSQLNKDIYYKLMETRQLLTNEINLVLKYCLCFIKRIKLFLVSNVHIVSLKKALITNQVRKGVNNVRDQRFIKYFN